MELNNLLVSNWCQHFSFRYPHLILILHLTVKPYGYSCQSTKSKYCRSEWKWIQKLTRMMSNTRVCHNLIIVALILLITLIIIPLLSGNYVGKKLKWWIWLLSAFQHHSWEHPVFNSKDDKWEALDKGITTFYIRQKLYLG